MRGVQSDPERREVRLLRQHAPLTDARVLEIGCGDGRVTRKIAGPARSIISTDVNPTDVANARRLVPQRLNEKIQFAVGSAEALQFRTHSFDVVVLSWSL